MPTNNEGLTYKEWICAAQAWGIPLDTYGNRISEGKLIRAWNAGHDPTEYAARSDDCGRQHWFGVTNRLQLMTNLLEITHGLDPKFLNGGPKASSAG